MRFGPTLRKVRNELRLDVCVGILVPTLWLLSPMSPFRDGSWGPARFQFVGYLAYFATAAAWLSFVLGLTAHSKQYGDAIAGGLAMPAAVAAVTGFVLFPVLPAAIGDVLAVLVLGGFVPFLVAVSLSRLAYKAFITSNKRRKGLFTATVLTAALVSALSAYAIWATDDERLVHQKISSLHVGQSLSLRETVPGPWTSVRVFGPYTSGDEIERRLGFKWDSPRKRVLEHTEVHWLLVFASKTTVVQSVVLRMNPDDGFCLDGQTIRRRGSGPCSDE